MLKWLTLRYVSCVYVLVGSDPFLHMYVNVNVYLCIRVQVMAGGHASSSLSEEARVDVCSLQLCIRMCVCVFLSGQESGVRVSDSEISFTLTAAFCRAPAREFLCHNGCVGVRIHTPSFLAPKRSDRGTAFGSEKQI